MIFPPKKKPNQETKKTPKTKTTRKKINSKQSTLRELSDPAMLKTGKHFYMLQYPSLKSPSSASSSNHCVVFDLQLQCDNENK